MRTVGRDGLGLSLEILNSNLNQLTLLGNTHLSKDKIAAMTMEDVPGALTPLATEIKHVLAAAEDANKKLQEISATSGALLDSGNGGLRVKRFGGGPQQQQPA